MFVIKHMFRDVYKQCFDEYQCLNIVYKKIKLFRRESEESHVQEYHCYHYVLFLKLKSGKLAHVVNRSRDDTQRA